MLRIRKQQLDAFREAARREFERECIALVLTHWRDLYAGWPDETIAAEVRELLEVAREWGFRGQRELYRVVNAGALLGLGFHRRDEGRWAVQTLRDPRLPFDMRITATIARVRAGETAR